MMVLNERHESRSQSTHARRNAFTSILTHTLVLAAFLLSAVWLPHARAQATDQPIYSDTLVNGWSDWGWGPHNYANTAPTHSGTASVSFTPYSWQGLFLHHSAIDTSPYASLSFWVHGGSSGGQQFWIQAVVNGNPQPLVVLNPFPANQWQQVIIPLATLGVANTTGFEGFWIQDASGSNQATVYLDDISLQSSRTLPPTPTNLRIKGVWQSGASTDTLTWDPVPGATAYTLYRYGQQLSVGISGTTFTVPTSPTNQWLAGLTYSVTAIMNGKESLPSNIVSAQGALDPAQTPSWYPVASSVPQNLTVVPQWNNGAPRVALKWKGQAEYFFDIYRDGLKIAEGLWGLNYIDTQVAQGESHSYAVSSVYVPWTNEDESTPCSSVSVTIPSQPSATVGVMATPTLVANDDSVLVSFAAVTGAVDYRAYLVDPSDPSHKHYKYSGGGLSIEMNGIDPVNGADIVVEAVDKLGPFVPMDDKTPHVWMIVNGQGDPSNLPQVIASSAAVHATCTSAVLTGSQAFFDTFRDSQAFVPVASMDSAIIAANSAYPNNASNPDVREYQNDKWVIRNYLGDMTNTGIFVMSNHFMDIFHDGGTPGGNNPLHVNYASLVMLPKASADISGGKVLHATFEVDPHMGNRRWCDVFVAEAGDPLIHPGNFSDNSNQFPTVSGNLFRWEITAQFHKAQVFKGNNGTRQEYPFMDLSYNPGNERLGPAARIKWDGTGLANGTAKDLDKRHKFDLYLSQTRMQIYEQGQLIKDTTFPTGGTLPFTQAAVYFVHQVYHSGLDRAELLTYMPEDSYWYNYRPWMDERHWDNMGFEVLTAFPQ